MGQFFFFKFFPTLRTISVNFGQNLVKNRVDWYINESQQCLQCCEIGHESQPVRHRISKSRPYILYIIVWTQYTDPLSNLPAVHRYTVFKQKCILYMVCFLIFCALPVATHARSYNTAGKYVAYHHMAPSYLDPSDVLSTKIYTRKFRKIPVLHNEFQMAINIIALVTNRKFTNDVQTTHHCFSVTPNSW